MPEVTESMLILSAARTSRRQREKVLFSGVNGCKAGEGEMYVCRHLVSQEHVQKSFPARKEKRRLRQKCTGGLTMREREEQKMGL